MSTTGRRASRSRPAARPRLAVLCTTHHDGRAVEQALLPLAKVADRIVVGADERVADQDLAHYARVADELFTYPYTGPNEFRGWLRDRTDADWILFVDGDEVPSEALLARLPSLLEDRDVSGYRIRRRWLHPDAGRFLADAPWETDHQTRLVRNDDRLWFPSTKHTGPSTTGSTRRIDEPLLHLDLLLTTFEQRRQKATRYESEHVGLLTRGQPTNELYYLPELRASLAHGELAVEDRRRVERVLAAVSSGTPARRGPVRLAGCATVEDIRRTVPWQPFTDEDAAATLELLGPVPSEVAARSRFVLDVAVRNEGPRSWPAAVEQLPAVRLSYHWDRGGERVVADGVRSRLPHLVRSGATAIAELVVDAPDEPGEHELVVDVVVENDRWFGRELVLPTLVTASVASRLAEHEDDGLVPLDVVSLLRIEAELPLELERLLGTGSDRRRPPAAELDPALDPEVAVALARPGVDVDVVAAMLRRLRARACGVVLQLGADRATVGLAAHAMASGALLVAVDHDARRATGIGTELDDAGVPDTAAVVVHAPLERQALGSLDLHGYDLRPVLEVLDGRSPDAVVVTTSTTGSVAPALPTIPALRSVVAAPIEVMVGDAWRDVPLAVARLWSVVDGIEVRGFARVGNGLLVAEVRPATPPS